MVCSVFFFLFFCFSRSQWKLPSFKHTRVSFAASYIVSYNIHLIIINSCALILISILILCSTGSFCPFAS
jgi:hypothetical protein